MTINDIKLYGLEESTKSFKYYDSGELFKIIYYNSEDKPFKTEWFYKDGKLKHYKTSKRVKLDKKNVDLSESYDGFPSEIYFYKNGTIKEISYYIKNTLHRDGNLPAYTLYASNGNKMKESYLVNGFLSRENDLPAIITYNHREGYELEYIFMVSGLSHREMGKASYLLFDKDKNIIKKKWFRFGVETSEEELIKLNEKYKSYFRKEKMKTLLGKNKSK